MEHSHFTHKSRIPRILSLLLSFLLTLSLAACAESPTEGGNSGSSSESENLADSSGSANLPGGSDTTNDVIKKRVALTFDDGPQHYEGRTKAIVDELAKYGYTATFFVVGNRVLGGDALAYAVEKGNELGIHGHTHECYYDTCSDERYEQEISQTLKMIHAVVPDYEVRLMRPIGGRISNERAAASPYSIILWNIDSLDWSHKYNSNDTVESAAVKVNTVVENIMSSVSDGDVILMHDIYESTYDAVVILLERLFEEGYEVVTVSELFGDALQPGQIYTNAY